MSNSFKWNVREGEEYPVINRILNSLFLSIAILFIGWPVLILPVILSLLMYWVYPGVVRNLIIVAWPLAYLFLFVWIFNDEKSKPYSGHGIYVAGSAPNPHKYQSSLWYAHEAMMDRERQAERDRNRYRD